MEGGEQYRAWIGRKRTGRDVVSAAPVARLAATLDRDDPAPAARRSSPTGLALAVLP